MPVHVYIMYNCWNCQNTQNCIILRTKFQNFSRGNTPGPHNVGGVTAEPPLVFFGYGPKYDVIITSRSSI